MWLYWSLTAVSKHENDMYILFKKHHRDPHILRHAVLFVFFWIKLHHQNYAQGSKHFSFILAFQISNIIIIYNSFIWPACSSSMNLLCMRKMLSTSKTFKMTSHFRSFFSSLNFESTRTMIQPSEKLVYLTWWWMNIKSMKVFFIP